MNIHQWIIMQIQVIVLVVCAVTLCKGQEASRLRVTTIAETPYTMMSQDKQGFVGFIPDILDRVTTLTNIGFDLRWVKDKKFGKIIDKKRQLWNGIIGELQRNESDLAAAPLTITASREEVVMFSKPFQTMGPQVVILKPEMAGSGTSAFLLLQPLSPGVWVLILVGYLLTSVVIYSVGKFDPYEVPNYVCDDHGEEKEEESSFTFLNCLWLTFSILTMQGYLVTPKAMATRTVFAFWWIFSALVMCTYIANFAGQIMAENSWSGFKPPVETVEDLAKQTAISYGTIADGSTQEFFRDSEIEVFRSMWSYMKYASPKVFEDNVDDAIERVRSSRGKYAFIMESAMAEYVIRQTPCDLMTVGGPMNLRSYALAAPKNSKYMARINQALQILLENGEITQLRNKWWKEQCADEETGSKLGAALKYGLPYSISMEDFATAYLVLAVGLVAGIAIAVLEVRMHQKEVERTGRDHRIRR